MYNGAAMDPSSYTLQYANNVNAGTAQVTVNASGNLQGSVTKTFAIDKADLSDVDIAAIPDQVFDGVAVEPTVVATLGGYQLTERDFAVAYADNDAAGTASVTITAKEDGNFTVDLGDAEEFAL